MVAPEIASHVSDRVRNAMAELIDQGDTLESLGTMLQEIAGVHAGAESEDLRRAAVSIQVSAFRALTCALAALIVGERLAALARFLDVQP